MSFNDVLRTGGPDWSKLQSVYALFRQMTGDDALSWTAHFCVAAAAAWVVALVWTRDTTPAVKSAALAAAAFLVTPYAYIYDATVLTVAAVFLLKDGAERGFRDFDKSLLLLCHLLPCFFIPGASHSAVAPLAAVLLLFLALRRAAPGSVRYAPAPGRPRVRTGAKPVR